MVITTIISLKKKKFLRESGTDFRFLYCSWPQKELLKTEGNLEHQLRRAEEKEMLLARKYVERIVVPLFPLPNAQTLMLWLKCGTSYVRCRTLATPSHLQVSFILRIMRPTHDRRPFILLENMSIFLLPVVLYFYEYFCTLNNWICNKPFSFTFLTNIPQHFPLKKKSQFSKQIILCTLFKSSRQQNK